MWQQCGHLSASSVQPQAKGLAPSPPSVPWVPWGSVEEGLWVGAWGQRAEGGTQGGYPDLDALAVCALPMELTGCRMGTKPGPRAGKAQVPTGPLLSLGQAPPRMPSALQGHCPHPTTCPSPDFSPSGREKAVAEARDQVAREGPPGSRGL